MKVIGWFNDFFEGDSCSFGRKCKRSKRSHKRKHAKRGRKAARKSNPLQGTWRELRGELDLAVQQVEPSTLEGFDFTAGPLSLDPVFNLRVGDDVLKVDAVDPFARQRVTLVSPLSKEGRDFLQLHAGKITEEQANMFLESLHFEEE